MIIKKISNFRDNEIACIKCGKQVRFSEELGIARCCNLQYETVAAQIDLVISDDLWDESIPGAVEHNRRIKCIE